MDLCVSACELMPEQAAHNLRAISADGVIVVRSTVLSVLTCSVAHVTVECWVPLQHLKVCACKPQVEVAPQSRAGDFLLIVSLFACPLCRALPSYALLIQEHLHDQPWCQTAVPDKRQFAEALKQHKSLDFFDYVTYDAFQVHPHLVGSRAV
jgi:hypothetical protein